MKLLLRLVSPAVMLVAGLSPAPASNPAPVVAERLSAADENVFFGYYDLPAVDTPRGRHLAHRVPFRDRLPVAGDEAELGVINLDGERVFRPFARTRAWNFQQGALLQWLGDGAGRVFYNDVQPEGGGYRGVLHDLATGERTFTDRALANLSRDGRWVHWGKVDPDRHDISESTHYPALGAYDSHDPVVIDRHIDQAKAHGLTGFIATWWGQGTYDDRAFVTLLERAEKKNFKVTVYWETAPGTGQRQVDQAISDLAYVLERYGSSPAFLKVEGKPVVFVYGRVMGQVPLKSWPGIVTGVRAKAGDVLLIADGYQAGYARMFDGVHTYNICDWVQGNKPDELRAMSASSFADAVQLARTHDRISCLTVIPGYDDTKIRTPGINAERQGGQTYRVLWEEAIKADPDWVLITSWNEWHEGSEIEPSQSDNAPAEAPWPASARAGLSGANR